MGKWSVYRKVAPVLAKQMDTPFRVRTREGIVQGKAGDYLCLGVENELWPVDKEIFERTMQRIGPVTSSQLKEIIKRHGSQWRLYSHTGKNLGTFPTKSAAKKHEREIEYFKSKK
jgi:hypothetical protein